MKKDLKVMGGIIWKINGHNYKEIFKALKKAQKSKNLLLFLVKLQLVMDPQTKVGKRHHMEVL